MTRSGPRRRGDAGSVGAVEYAQHDALRVAVVVDRNGAIEAPYRRSGRLRFPCVRRVSELAGLALAAGTGELLGVWFEFCA